MGNSSRFGELGSPISRQTDERPIQSRTGGGGSIPVDPVADSLVTCFHRSGDVEDSRAVANFPHETTRKVHALDAEAAEIDIRQHI